MTEEGEWPRVLRFLVGAVVGASISAAGSCVAATSTPWLIVISAVSGIVVGVLALVFGNRLWEFLP